MILVVDILRFNHALNETGGSVAVALVGLPCVGSLSLGC
jgi:hypothetical protein